ncbi:hypothetical protein CLV24_1454 [Pontibacter ummariensis]|uniref:Uncharacterized protein n=2 Tax=Pontibacter ummariensis TaxID=1610492 RepID=A0A239LPM9_9BACT|nr:hypothetical protein CLV24_1454 [Pontibacter ummariensis]SNT32230.1 hypothetical protein SAMN06296052_1469 [Pontibacter ummariensis]
MLAALIALSGLFVWGSRQHGSRGEANGQKESAAKVDTDYKVVHASDSTSGKLQAYNSATDFVIASLQEPRTAEFPTTKEKLKHIKYLGDKRYQVDSWVDSQDTYGAMTRRSFSCIIKIDGASVIKERFMIEENGYIPRS